jgi:hypothetical protein
MRWALRAAYPVLVLSFASPSIAAEDIVLRTSVTPEQVWVGQRATLHIDVLGKDGWAQIKTIRDFDVPGAYVMRTQSQGTRLQETIGGVSYTGQRYALSLYPQKGGPVEVPALPVEVTIRAWGVNAGETVQPAEIPSTTFTSQVPPGAEGIRGLISTTRLTASQAWEPETDNVEVGDAVKRMITLRASDVSGMAFAPIEYPAMEGLGVYPGEPTVEDESNRGSLTGTRIETVTYVFERPGQIEIPGIAFSWWHVGAGELKRIELPGLALRVVGSLAPESGAAARTGHRQQRTWLLWSALAALALTAVVAVRFRNRLMAYWLAWRVARSETEPTYFRRVMKSVRSGDPKAALRETMRWLDRINVDQEPARLGPFLGRYGDAEVQEAAVHLVDSLCSGGVSGDLSALGRGLAAARTRWRRRRRRKEHATGALPELNALEGSFEC